jgi:DNA invertase Pin-like site-specific DNA recombinase
MQKYFIYARKSSDSEDKQILSIEAQVFELKEYVKNKIPDALIIDQYTESRTAKEPGRVIFNKMLSRIEKGEADGIIAWHPDRLARNSIDGGKIIHMVDKGLIKYLEFPTYRFDNSAQGKFMLNIIFGQSKYYVDNLSENVKRGIRQKLRRGEWPSYARIGYTNNLKTKKIEIDPILGPKIKQLFEQYITGDYSLDGLAAYAESIGLVGRFKNKRITKSNIVRILINPIYCGIIKYTGEVFEGKHEPIISKDLFDKAQSVYRIKSRPKPIKHQFFFTGLMKCPYCGCMITAEKQKGHVYYRCTKKRGTCASSFIRAEELHEIINDKIKCIVVSDELNNYLKTKVTEEKHALSASISDEVQKLDKQTNDIENKINRLLDLYLENTISKRDFGKKKELMLEEKLQLEQQLKYLEKGQFYWLELLEEFINGLDKPKRILETDNLLEKRKFLENIGSNFSLGLAHRASKNAPVVLGAENTKPNLGGQGLQFPV